MNDLTVSTAQATLSVPFGAIHLVSEMNIFQLHIRSGTMFWLCRLWQFLHIKKCLDTGLYLYNNSSTFPEIQKGL